MDKMWLIISFDAVGKPYIHSSYGAYQEAVDAAYDLPHELGLWRIVEVDL